MFKRIGIHIPDEPAREIAAWSEEWLRNNPNIHCIPVSSPAYRRNTYTTTKTSLLTYTQWTEAYERYAQQYDPGRRA